MASTGQITGNFTARHRATTPWVSLSAKGSSILPSSVTWSNFLAIMPSNRSDRPENTSSPAAVYKSPSKKRQAKKGTTKMRSTERALGTVRFLFLALVISDMFPIPFSGGMHPRQFARRPLAI